MQFTFKELFINPAKYNGWTASQAIAEIVNITANWVKVMYLVQNTGTVTNAKLDNMCDYNIFRHFNWDVDFINHTVTIPPDALLN